MPIIMNAPFIGLLAAVLACVFAARADDQHAFRLAVEVDWAKQEQRWNRAPDHLEAIHEALARAKQSFSRFPPADQPSDLLGRLSVRAASAEKLPKEERAALYNEIRWAGREAVLRNPLFPRAPIAFMKRNRFICQMLHEYLGYFYDYGNVSGGGVHLLEQPGRSFKTRDLIQGRLPRGNFATLALDFSGTKLYFAFAERAETKPAFASKERRSFHLFELDTATSALKQLTHGLEDDFDPCPLPDGGLAFVSSRRGAFCRCNNPWEPIPTYTLHRMAPDGSEIKTLSFHETNEWHPWVLNDGRLVYTRWDYVDRSAANFHGLWTTNPDGSSPASLFGNYTMRINACYQPRAIPGSDRILFVAGAHHADVGGSLVLLDPGRAKLDPQTGEDDFGSIETLTPDICFAEASGWPKTYFHSPWPLSEDCFLTAFSFDPLPGMSSGESRDTRTGLYLFDRWGNLELLCQDAEISSMYPLPLAPRQRPPAIQTLARPELGDEGEFILQDVNRSHFPMPADRKIVALRVFQVLPKTGSHIANDPRLGYANAESARMLLGSVPVEEDGSAYFRLPARKPVYFQAVDASGRAVQSMRSITYLQPGERRSCIGCHEGPNVSPPRAVPLAARREPSRLQPGPDGTLPMSFARLVQPVLDRQCSRCHDPAQPGAVKPALTAAQTKDFSESYDNLRPFVRWYEWGDRSISQIATRPGEIGADQSPLTRVLEDRNHQPLHIPNADLRRIYLWLDANAPFYGVYDKPQRLAQRAGELVSVPALQ